MKKHFANILSIVLLMGGVFTCIVLTSCENFLFGGELKKQIQADLNYAKAPFYTISVQAVANTGIIKIPLSGEVEKKVTDTFSVKFEPAANHTFIKWEAYFTDSEENEEDISDYIETKLL